MATKAGRTHPIGVLSCYSCVSTFPGHGDFEFCLPSRHGWGWGGATITAKSRWAFYFVMWWRTVTMAWPGHIIARKRSLRRLCFHRCLSVHRGGVCPIACWDTPPTPNQRQTPPGQTPPCAVHAGVRSTSGRYASHWNSCWIWMHSFNYYLHPNKI